MPSVEDLSSGDTSPLKGPAPKAQPEDTADIDKHDDAMPLTSPGDQPVQFVTGQPANGDAKVEIGDAGGGPAFVGLGKEELMKYANDPFWVRLRWFLFILFWALWVAMLAGAIVIIVLAPKCAEKKSAPESFYELNLKNFAKDGKLSDLAGRVDYLADLGVSSVIIRDVLKKDNVDGTLDYKNVDAEIGTISEFADALKKIKNAGIRVLMALVPNHSSLQHEWFNDHQFHDYYVRKSSAEVFGSTWKKVDTKEDAWVDDTSGHGGGKFLQLFNGTADLNYLNDKVVNEMTGVFSFWRSKGVDAFVIPAASYLVEDLGRLNDDSAVRNTPKNLEVLKTILNQDGSDVHSLAEVAHLSTQDAEKFYEAGIVPLSDTYDYLQKLDQYAAPNAKITFFKEVHKANHPVVRISDPNQRLQNQNQDEANIIRLLAYTSKGSVILHSGDEVDGFDTKAKIMNWDKTSSTGTTFTFLKKLTEVQRTLKEENEAEFSYPYKGNNVNVFAFVRSGKYVVAVNFGHSETTVDIGELLGDPAAKTQVIIATPNAVDLTAGITVTGTLTLPPRSGVLLEKVDG